MNTPRDDARYMASAIALSQRGRGRTAPNPNVGCVIVRDGVIVGRGWTQPGGRPHAEAQALAQAADRAEGATAYATLEPCYHLSPRGPRCVDLIERAGIARVVVAVTDPDPRTNGQAMAHLRAHGISVTSEVLAAQAREAMAGFFMRQHEARPFVTLKLGLSLDGCIALGDGTSRWITSERARAHAHLERARHDAILVGRGTWSADSPMLDVRLHGLEDRAPLRLVLGRGDAPAGWSALSEPAAVADLPRVEYLMVEGGARTASAFLRADLVDRLLLYRAPVLLGGRAAVADLGLVDLARAHGRWKCVDDRMLGPDRMEVYLRTRTD